MSTTNGLLAAPALPPADDDTPRPATITAALAYVRRGWSVVPCCTPTPGRPSTCHQHGPCKNAGKRPLVRWEDYQAEPPTEDQVRDWFTPAADQPVPNIGLITGEASGLVVLDLDGQAAFDEAERRGYLPGPSVATGRVGGRHIYMAWRDDVPRNFVHKGDSKAIDLRSEAGIVIAPPSIHNSGRTYAWLDPLVDGEPLPPLPQWVNDIAAEGIGPNGERPRLDTARLFWQGVPDGERDVEIFRLAAKLRGLGMPYESAALVVRDAAERCNPPFEDWEVKLDSAYTRYPAGGGRARLAAPGQRQC